MSNEILSKVVYRYPNEQQRTIEGANNWGYSVEYINTTIWQAIGTATNIHGDRIAFISEPVTEKQGTIIATDVFSLTPRIGQDWSLQAPSYYDPSDTTLRLVSFGTYTENEPEPTEPGITYQPEIIGTSSGQTLKYWRHPRTRFGWDSSIREYLYQEKPVINYWQPANGTPLYTLHIYQGENEVFSRTEEFFPVQVFLVENCPDNTCPVDCGTHICCYGSDGIAVSYYNKF